MARQRASSRPWRGLLVVAVAALAVASCRHEIRGPARDPIEVVVRATSPSRLVAFRSEGELREFLEDLAEARELELGSKGRPSPPPAGAALSAKEPCVPATCESLGVSCGVHPDGCGKTVSCGSCGEASPAPADSEGYAYEFSDEPAAAAPDAESITNVQHAGVDEGGIVKLRGDHLVVLRRGRLFTIDIGGGRLRPISSADAFGPDVDPEGTWYDEMLVSEHRVVVIGYSYARGGTEVGLFDLDAAGRLTHRSTYQLRSDDYYASRNYASRLVGDKLIFYTPHYLEVTTDDVFGSFPAIRRWAHGADADDFERIAPARRVYRPLLASTSITLHSVSVCDLGGSELDCESTVVMGPPGRVFYVAPKAVYVWVAGWDDRTEEDVSLVYRMPLDGSAPSVLRGDGVPIDQFSFLEDDGFLNVLLRADGEGEGMWGAEASRGRVALMRVPVASFGSVARSHGGNAGVPPDK